MESSSSKVKKPGVGVMVKEKLSVSRDPRPATGEQ